MKPSNERTATGPAINDLAATSAYAMSCKIGSDNLLRAMLRYYENRNR